MKSSDTAYNSKRIVTLIHQTLEGRKIWFVEITTNEWVEKVYRSHSEYRWEIDCDLDAFILWQNEIESADSELVLSRQTTKAWKDFVLDQNRLSEDFLSEWLMRGLAELKERKDSGNYPYSDLVPIIAQDRSGKILMQAWGNRDALFLSLESGLGHYFSRSRNKLWMKGEESGHFQKIFAWTLEDRFPFTVVYHVDQKGAACHTGRYSCFFREMKTWNDPCITPL